MLLLYHVYAYTCGSRNHARQKIVSSESSFCFQLNLACTVCLLQFFDCAALYRRPLLAEACGAFERWKIADILTLGCVACFALAAARGEFESTFLSACFLNLSGSERCF